MMERAAAMEPEQERRGRVAATGNGEQVLQLTLHFDSVERCEK